MHSAATAAARPRVGDILARSVDQVGVALVALFEHVDRLPDKVQWVHRHVVADMMAVAGPLDPALDRACAAVAAAIDADAVALDRHPYHNRQHFCEVALTAYVLCLLGSQDSRAMQFVLLAALIHDLGHDGGSHEAFRQERASVERARPLLELAGLDAVQLQRMAALVLATDVARGSAFMAATCKAHLQAGGVAPAIPAGAPELAALVADAGLAELARVLCEADVLPSIGLSIEHAMRLQMRLAREWRRDLDDRDKLAFIDEVLRQDFIGDFFRPNVEATRRALVRTPHAPVPS